MWNLCCNTPAVRHYVSLLCYLRNNVVCSTKGPNPTTRYFINSLHNFNHKCSFCAFISGFYCVFYFFMRFVRDIDGYVYPGVFTKCRIVLLNDYGTLKCYLRIFVLIYTFNIVGLLASTRTICVPVISCYATAQRVTFTARSIRSRSGMTNNTVGWNTTLLMLFV